MLNSPLRSKAALAMLAVGTFSYVTIEVMPIGLLTVMADDLGRSRPEVGLLVTGYAVVVVLATIPLTLLTHRLPRRLVIGGTLAVFTAGAGCTALAPTYGALFAARLITALSQALFWAVVVPVAAGLFPPAVRGRAVGRLTIGAALAPVVGVPAGTWLGERAGWQAPFAVMAGAGLVTCLGIVTVLPRVEAQYGAAGRGTEPDVRRYVVLVFSCATGVAGFLTANTYITPFLLEVSGFGVGALTPILLVSGLGGLTGTLLIGMIFDRRPWTAVVLPLVLITFALIGLYALGELQVPAVLFVGLAGMAYSALAVSLLSRTLQVAPGNTDLASAGTNTAFNVGIAAGAFIGGGLIDGAGARSVALVGGMLTAAALTGMLAEPRLARSARMIPAAAPCRPTPRPQVGIRG